MNINWQAAKQAGLFLLVAIPSVFVLTKLAAWTAAWIRFRRRRGPGLPVPPVPPEKSGYEKLEDFRKEAEELSVGDVLERASGRAPENPALVETRIKDAARWKLDEILRGYWARFRGGAPHGPDGKACLCRECGGTGLTMVAAGASPVYHACLKCKGTGREA